MSALVFVDTNVLIYALDKADPVKPLAARAWREALWRSGRGRVSFQVLLEFCVTVRLKQRQAREEARAEVRDLLAWRPVELGASAVERAWKIQDRYGPFLLGCFDCSRGKSRSLPLSADRGPAGRPGTRRRNRGRSFPT
jgi:predicted nucleic acid-binding protein